ncbi:hypothetical protein D3C80_1525410 [compost metagenome]
MHVAGAGFGLQLGVMGRFRDVGRAFGNLLDTDRDFFHGQQIFVTALGLQLCSLRNLTDGQGNLLGLCGCLLRNLFDHAGCCSNPGCGLKTVSD